MNEKKNLGYCSPLFNQKESARVLGKDFNDLIDKYKEIAKTRYASWPEKYASLSFMYKGKPYYIGKTELECDDMQFVMVERDLTAELYRLGAYDVFYTGMLD